MELLYRNKTPKIPICPRLGLYQRWVFAGCRRFNGGSFNYFTKSMVETAVQCEDAYYSRLCLL